MESGRWLLGRASRNEKGKYLLGIVTRRKEGEKGKKEGGNGAW